MAVLCDVTVFFLPIVDRRITIDNSTCQRSITRHIETPTIFMDPDFPVSRITYNDFLAISVLRTNLIFVCHDLTRLLQIRAAASTRKLVGRMAVLKHVRFPFKFLLFIQA